MVIPNYHHREVSHQQNPIAISIVTCSVMKSLDSLVDSLDSLRKPTKESPLCRGTVRFNSSNHFNGEKGLP